MDFDTEPDKPQNLMSGRGPGGIQNIPPPPNVQLDAINYANYLAAILRQPNQNSSQSGSKVDMEEFDGNPEDCNQGGCESLRMSA